MTSHPPFDRVLIANRGEIALRVIRACRELGISPVAVYGEGEEQAVHVRAADDAYRLPSGNSLPYLNISALVEIAQRAGAKAIHPGYGFLAENAGFAEACEAAGIVFVGPSAAAIRAMGDKVEARRIAIEAGVPITPGTPGPIATVEDAIAWASGQQYPIAVKAAAGGGGRGFRVARSEAELADAFTGAAGEAQRYFANPIVYLERYIERPRHIEIQVFADAHRNAVSLGERDCSVQRRHQKLIEETPSPAIGPETRRAMGDAATALARRVGYLGAGTVEFLYTQDGSFYFLEMNTRIQVEHTVTEMVTGFDLVKEQFRVAAGLPLSFTQEQVQPRGHAIQCRINAEDAGRDFKPSPGKISSLRLPSGPGVRVDTAMESGGEILPTYDSLIAKLMVWGRDRDEALARMRRALAEFHVEGVPTTIPFHQRMMEHEVFAAGLATTAFLPENPEVIPSPATVEHIEGGEAPEFQDLLVEVDGRRLTVRLPGSLALAPATNGSAGLKRAPAKAGVGKAAAKKASGPELTSPLQGKVLRVLVEPGAQVVAGQLVCVVEAMKMENEIAAHRDGVVSAVAIKPGDAVKIGASLATIGD